MITFLRTADCSGCTAIQDALEELCIAHKVVLLRREQDFSNFLPEGTRPPVLIDDDEVIQGSQSILVQLEKLEKFKALWDKFQTDACYCDEEGNVE